MLRASGVGEPRGVGGAEHIGGDGHNQDVHVLLLEVLVQQLRIARMPDGHPGDPDQVPAAVAPLGVDGILLVLGHRGNHGDAPHAHPLVVAGRADALPRDTVLPQLVACRLGGDEDRVRPIGQLRQSPTSGVVAVVVSDQDDVGPVDVPGAQRQRHEERQPEL